MIEHLGDRRVIASVSGGKDSAALSLWLTEQGIDHDRVFLDTGWEHPLTYEYLRGELARVLGPITEVQSPLGMAGLCRKKGMFPSRTRRFCTQELKIRPMQEYLRGLRHCTQCDGPALIEGEQTGDFECECGGDFVEDDVVNAVGIRAAESEARAKLGEWEWSEGFDCEVWRPLIRWTEQDVIDIHTRHGLRPNPLYLLGARRVGCWPCIFSRKAEIRFLAERDPARVDAIRELEREVAVVAEARHAARGEAMKHRPCFFQAREAVDGGNMVPIDDVVAWSRTSRGGRQFELFAPEHEGGCVRWGLCDIPAADAGATAAAPDPDNYQRVCDRDRE